MWPINLCHDFRYGKIMYNQLDEFVGRSLRLYGEFSQGEASLFEQIVEGHEAERERDAANLFGMAVLESY